MKEKTSITLSGMYWLPSTVSRARSSLDPLLSNRCCGSSCGNARGPQSKLATWNGSTPPPSVSMPRRPMSWNIRRPAKPSEARRSVSRVQARRRSQAVPRLRNCQPADPHRFPVLHRCLCTRVHSGGRLIYSGAGRNRRGPETLQLDHVRQSRQPAQVRPHSVSRLIDETQIGGTGSGIKDGIGPYLAETLTQTLISSITYIRPMHYPTAKPRFCPFRWDTRAIPHCFQ